MITDIILAGGILPMGIMTILLIALFLAFWKARRCVKYIGFAALAAAVLLSLLDWIPAIGAIIEANGEVASTVIWAGLRHCLVLLAYGLIIYLVSLVLRLILKLRK